MHVISRKALRDFVARERRAKTPCVAWYKVVSKASWSTPQEVKAAFGTNVDFVRGNRAIFDLGGNKYRIVAVMAYRSKRMFIRFVGTHDEYDRINAETV